MWQNHSVEGKPAAIVPSGAYPVACKEGWVHRAEIKTDQPTEKAGGKSQEH